MISFKTPLITAAAALLVTAAAPATRAADLSLHLRHHRHHHAHIHHLRRPWFSFSYSHNYGPAYVWPDGAIAAPDRVIVPRYERAYGLYDGHRAYCAQSSASYRGQDGRQHPCA
jgi:hypothetical protein